MSGQDPAAQPFAAGHRLGPFEIIRPLGTGAFADVYRALDTVLDRDVALKIIRDPEAEPSEMEGARIMCRLVHPNIVRVHSADRIDGRLVIAMDYVDGKTLQDVLKENKRLELSQAIAVAQVITGALDYVHAFGIDGSCGLAHLDLKPSNILIDPRGTVRIADFGLAQRFHAPAEVAARAGGSPAYMAPEQFRGEGTAKSDLWALGIVLSQMLTGQTPFRADSFEMYRGSICEGEPQWGSEFECIPAPVKEIIRRCLRRDPAERFQSARELAAAIQAIQPDTTSKTCSRCGARLPEGSDFCPECTFADRKKAKAVDWTGNAMKAVRPASPRFPWLGLIVAAILLAISYSGYRIWRSWHEARLAREANRESSEHTVPGTISVAPIKKDAVPGNESSQARRALEQKQRELARLNEAWEDILTLEKSDKGTHQDRIRALTGFMDTFPQSAQAKSAAAKIQIWKKEADQFAAAEALETSPGAKISEKLARWKLFYEQQKTGFRLEYAGKRSLFWASELEKYTGYAMLRVKSATGLPPTDAAIFGGEQPDPYFVILAKNNVLYQSRVIENNPHPVWNDEVRIYLQPERGLVLEIRDRDVMGYDLLFHGILERLPGDGDFQLTIGSIQVQLAIAREK
jgi:serine/threonine protein kinase